MSMIEMLQASVLSPKRYQPRVEENVSAKKARDIAVTKNRSRDLCSYSHI
jgi:hypothetical protein